MTVELTFEKFQLFRSVLLQGANCNTRRHIVTHCNTLQHTATHCNTLQHTATQCRSRQRPRQYAQPLSQTAPKAQRRTATIVRDSGGPPVAPSCCRSFFASIPLCAHCNTLQHTATHCYSLQHTATHATPADHPLRLLAEGLCWS